jgi:type I restriction enzyme S subunit
MSWKTVALGDVCEMYQPKTITSKELIPDGEYFVYGANGIIGKYSSFNHESPQLVIGCRGSVGSVHVTKPKSWITGNAMVINPRNNDINIRFLEYFFRGAVDLSKAITGTAQPQITRTSLSPITFRYPSPSIQQKIVSKLDAIFVEIDKVMAAAEANSKNAEVLFQSYLNSIFKLKGNNWITTKLNEICEKITDGTHQTPTYFDDGVIFLSSKNVTTGKIDWDNIKYIDTKQHIEMSKSISPKVGDILLAKNGTTGVAAMVDKDIVFNIYVSLALLRAKAQVLPKLLLYFINSPVAKKQFNSRLKGSGVPNLHLQEIRQVEISFPKSLENQRELILQIERFLDVTSILITKYKNKKNEILLLKQAILKQAFNGELVKAA